MISARFALAGLLVSGAASFAWAQPDTEPKLIDLDFSGTPMSKAMKEISRKSGHAIKVDPKIRNEPVSIGLRKIPWRAAVDVIARLARCEVEERDGVPYVTRIPKVTLESVDADIRGVLEKIAEAGGKKIVLGPGVKGTTSVSLKEVQWLRALKAVVWAAKLEAAEEGGVLRITRRTGESQAPPPRFGKAWALSPLGLDETAEEKAPLVSLNVKDMDLYEVIEDLGRQAEKNVLVDPNVDAKVTLRVERIPWTKAVKMAAEKTGCRIENRRQGLLLLTHPPASTLRARRVPASVWFRVLAKHWSKSIVVASTVRSLIDAEFQGVYLDVAIQAAAKASGSRVDRLTKGLLVVTNDRDRSPAVEAADGRKRRPGEGPLKLQAAVIDIMEGNTAVISGRIYREGANTTGPNGKKYSVVWIHKEEVILVDENRDRLRLTLKSD